MKTNLFVKIPVEKKPEQGAALVTAVIMMLLILVVSATILLVTALSNSSTLDAVAERQAYEAAEAGMQQTLNILRGNGVGETISFREAAIRTLSNKADDWVPDARLSKWLNYSYPAAQPDRVPLTSPYNVSDGLAFSVTINVPDAPPVVVVPTPNPTWVDGPVVKPDPPVKPPRPAWHPWHCAHCSWDPTHCSLYNPPNNGTLRADGMGCRHKHCIPPPNWGGRSDDGYQRLLIKVTGYGPRGARKQLELLVKRVIFEYDADSLLYMQGSQLGGDASFVLAGVPEVKFDSQEKTAFVITNDLDRAKIETVIAQKDKVTITGKGDDYEVINADERPKFLASADEARLTVSDLEADAQVRGRWFNSYPPLNAGTDSMPAFTFVRGNAQLSGKGAGLLVVTGDVTLNSNFEYKGLILILGSGRLNMTVGSDSKIEGSVIMAQFGATGNFQGPIINATGGKTEFKINQEKVDAALKTVNMRVVAVREN
jgi:hypothetical protein